MQMIKHKMIKCEILPGPRKDKYEGRTKGSHTHPQKIVYNAGGFVSASRRPGTPEGGQGKWEAHSKHGRSHKCGSKERRSSACSYEVPRVDGGGRQVSGVMVTIGVSPGELHTEY